MERKRFFNTLWVMVTLVSLLLAACQPAATPTQPPAPAATEPPAAATQPPAAAFKACQVTDTGGIDDKSFNATAWKGVQDAIDQLGIEGKYLESQQQTDYDKNINAFIDEGCNIIITVGFLLGDATKAAAEKNPNQLFSIVDFAYDPPIPNVLGQVFNTNEAGFLAGYVAAGVSKTGKVGTFGGIQIPTVTVFMDGFALGVQYYNEKHGTNVEVLGWDANTQTGLFTGNYGADGAGTTTYALGVSAPGAASGVYDTATGQQVYLYLEGGQVVGRVGSGGSADPSGAVAFVISVNASGTVTLDQQRAEIGRAHV